MTVVAMLVISATAVASVRVWAVPEVGLQPDVAVGPGCIVHLGYLRGEAGSAGVPAVLCARLQQRTAGSMFCLATSDQAERI